MFKNNKKQRTTCELEADENNRYERSFRRIHDGDI